MREEVEYVIQPNKKEFLRWAEIWQYRELFYFFAWRDVKVKYKQTVLGIVWVLIQPIMTIAIFSLFFGRALKIPSLGLPYPVFVFSGLLFWNFFSTSLNTAGNSMMTNAAIIKKIYFPRLIIPLSAVLTALIDFFISFLFFALTLIYFKIQIDVRLMILLWPLAFLSLLTTAIGISTLLAALTVKYRDFKYVIPFGLQLMMFLTPVIYPTAILNSPMFEKILALNPMHAPIMLLRAPLLNTSPDWMLIAISLAFGASTMLAGLIYFRRTEDYFADLA